VPQRENPTKRESTLVTVITVVFQGAAALEHTIKSVVSQTYSNIEYIVIDGGSTDGTVEIIQQYEKHIKWWTSERDNGIYDAMNKGARAAKGSWILFLNAGDTFFDHAVLENFNDFVTRMDGPAPDLIFGDVMMVYPGMGEEKRILKNTLFFLIRNMICHQCIFYSKSAFQSVGPFNAQLKFASDFEHFARLKWGNFRIAKIDLTIARYLLDGVSAQPGNIKKIWSERMKIYEHAKEMPALIRFVFWIYAKAAFEFRSRVQ